MLRVFSKSWIYPRLLLMHTRSHLLVKPIYPMVGELLSNEDRARILSKVFNRSIEYKQYTIHEQYDLLTKTLYAPQKMAYDFAQDFQPDHNYSPGLSLVLGREPETLEQWLINNKDLFSSLNN